MPQTTPFALRLLSALARVLPGALFFPLVGRTRLRAVPRVASSAWRDAGGALAGLVATQCAHHPGCSGFALLEDGHDAFLARAALADHATHAIDLQYYSYDADLAGLVLMQRLALAAERGVRVRILVDDSHLTSAERHFIELDAQPNLEVRIFNPAPARRGLARVLHYLARVERLNRRLHSKVFAVDGAVAIVGGRNVGDSYFGARARGFHDLDLLMAGPAAGEANAAFDRAWNSEFAVPIAAFVPRDLPPERALARREKIERRLRRRLPDLDARYLRARAALERSLAGEGELVWAPGRVLADTPERVAGRETAPVVADALERLLAGAAREVLIESAYFVPGMPRVAALGALVARGVRVKVLTNGLAATDVPIAHAGYAPYRVPLLREGVELHEFRRRPRGLARLWSRETEETALHAKAVVVDRRHAWVGSFNVDPRSARLNMEIGVLVESETLAARLARHVLADCTPERAWRLQLDATEPPRLVWLGTRRGRALAYRHEPHASLARRLAVAAAGWIPGLEDVL